MAGLLFAPTFAYLFAAPSLTCDTSLRSAVHQGAPAFRKKSTLNLPRITEFLFANFFIGANSEAETLNQQRAGTEEGGLSWLRL